MEKITGNIHSMESFGTVDGPVIRTVIFMQGFKLRCKYCHNRDTWKPGIGKDYTVKETVDYILKYKPYFEASEGGVTVSGGEPLLQPLYIYNLFKELKKYGIHTALDTAGNFEITKEIEKVLEVTDLVLLDIKHIDDKKCVSLCGIHNNLELEFAQYLDKIGKPTWIRQVLVPGYTDKKEDLENLRDFLMTLNNIENVEILPYKGFGRYKWEEMGINYPLDGVSDASEEDVKKAKEILQIEKIVRK